MNQRIRPGEVDGEREDPMARLASLVIQRAKGEGAGTEREMSSLIAHARIAEGRPALDGVIVLLVSDDSALGRRLTRYLAEGSAHLVTVPSAPQALALMAATALVPDALLIEDPQEGGPDALTSRRAIEAEVGGLPTLRLSPVGMDTLGIETLPTDVEPEALLAALTRLLCPPE